LWLLANMIRTGPGLSISPKQRSMRTSSEIWW
jgi:hypothetical protein